MQSRPGILRVLALDEHALVRDCLSRFVAAEEGIEIAGQSGDAADALRILCGGMVDIVLLALDGERGLAFLEKLRERGHAARVLALANDDLDDAAAVAMVRAGASGIFSTRGSPQELVRAIREIGAGGRWLAVRYVDALMRAAANPGPARGEQPLTERQRRVLRGVTEGFANKQIGVRLGLSESAVKSTLQQLFRQTGARKRAQLVRIAFERKMIPFSTPPGKE